MSRPKQVQFIVYADVANGTFTADTQITEDIASKVAAYVLTLTGSAYTVSASHTSAL
jgi:hypothetical protein